MARRSVLLSVASIVLLLFILVPLIQKPYSFPIHLLGHHDLKVPADRATISIQVSSEGGRQHKVADEVRQTTDEILSLLRPLTLPPNRTESSYQNFRPSASLPSDFMPPLATLSVNTFSSHSYPRSSLLGETTSYHSSITITAEFRSLPQSQQSSNATTIPSTSFPHLSLLLPRLAKIPRTKINSLKWFLSPTYLADLQSQARRNAMDEALTKASDYMAPMNLRFPSVRCVSLQEENKRHRRHEHLWDDFLHDGIRKQGNAARMSKLMQDPDVYGYDELDYSSGRYGYEIEDAEYEAFGLEPQSIEIGSDIKGEFVVVERSWVRMLTGYVF